MPEELAGSPRSEPTRTAADAQAAASAARPAQLVHLPQALTPALERARAGLLDLQRAEGCWCFELEADCTIPAEYILMMHFMAEIDSARAAKLAVYLRERQAEHGGWPLYYGGDLDLSCSVKCYWALKLCGDDSESAHMQRAREAILERGGAAASNVFTRIAMALFGHVPWRATPFLPVEVVLLPRWFPFQLMKVSYWSRTVMVPLAILCSLKARAKNPSGIRIDELFVTPPERERNYFPVRSKLNRALLLLERTARLFEGLIPGFVRRRALTRAEEWFTERLNGTDGLGGIFPAMVNAYESLDLLGYAPEHPLRRDAKRALERLLVEHESWAYCQPCFSPIWDTGLACLALQDVQRTCPEEATSRAIERAASWMKERQILDGPADWRAYRPDLAPGGWAFQFANPHYPDLDDTSVVAWALAQQDRRRHGRAIRRAADWLRGMQSENGGFASFDADNTHAYLNHIPFADHGALLDPPTADVSARCAALFGLLGREADRAALSACLDYLYREQEPNGSWFGRWGTNYVYGTWSVLSALEHVSDEKKHAHVERAMRWLESVQRPDGSWGESNDSYRDPEMAGEAPAGTVFQTAWAVLGLLASGEGDSLAVRRGIEYLIERQAADGLWEEDWYTAPGFPRVFYLRYHGYARYFPLWALARYQRALAEQAAPERAR